MRFFMDSPPSGSSPLPVRDPPGGGGSEGGSFEDNAEEAVRFYTSNFRNSRITSTTRYDEEGASWQIVPTVLGELLNTADPEKSRNAMKALLGMKKIDMEALTRAAGRQRAA
jgi:3-demethylubiquinone-9 3-methyltransferase